MQEQRDEVREVREALVVAGVKNRFAISELRRLARRDLSGSYRVALECARLAESAISDVFDALEEGGV